MRVLSTFFSLFVASTLAVDVRTVYQFPNQTWLENIITMRNGSLLVTFIGRAEVHIVNPSPGNATSSLVASLPNANAVLGITEISDDVFAVGAGQVTPRNTPINGTFAVWKIDLSHKKETKISKIADVPKVGLINGIQALNPHTILLADSWAGNIAKVNTKTGAYEVALSHPSLASNFSEPALPLGANGIKFHDGYVYYTNTVQAILGRVRVSPSGHPIGPFTILASGPNISVPDDLAVAKDGSVYLARIRAGTLQHVTLDGKVVTIAEGGPVAGVTSARFGRTKKDRNVLYLSTMGGFGADGLPAAGGRVAAVTLEKGGKGYSY
ncbi:uncharacterized protein K460DRAFT_362430 [Cucurbitaria berberidis CBS 394.84]|uniref:SMP-30/Gluconolactonase/LRE-like region domain-containing protein n=1 Tax=Cucurbitaria berberidis CBS 394.84 TaxID=1168544 RepID=A0A9P4GUC1_9PLEO|nr:uncharacterized protein K460DRAFT_362430 [Cucurbitaria berberidis CBS 394.84]KAF1851686.1 hypothetical protein K460DRAFT_362430 [Cucurbitaria berberidis CBS 394.84]